jgi:hypothetical protein
MFSNNEINTRYPAKKQSSEKGDVILLKPPTTKSKKTTKTPQKQRFKINVILENSPYKDKRCLNTKKSEQDKQKQNKIKIC